PLHSRERAATVSHWPANSDALPPPHPTPRKSCIERNDWPKSSYGYRTPSSARRSRFWNSTFCRYVVPVFGAPTWTKTRLAGAAPATASSSSSPSRPRLSQDLIGQGGHFVVGDPGLRVDQLRVGPERRRCRDQIVDITHDVETAGSQTLDRVLRLVAHPVVAR